MLTYLRTNILESNAHTLVNTVNTVGVMGKGLAAAFKTRYPEMFAAYRELCATGRFQMGQLWLWKTPDRWILNFPTKKHWRNPSRISYIEAGLEKFVAQYQQRGIREISFPKLGCGNGGLDWADVNPLMEHYLAPLPIPVYIHDYDTDIGLPEHKEIVLEKAFLRSFDVFLDDLRETIKSRQGKFHTVSNGTAFSVFLEDDNSLIIERHNGTKKKTKIMEDDLYEIWNLLLNGPIDRNKLSSSKFI